MIKRLFLFLAISIVTISCKDTRDINLTEAETEANKVTASVDTYAKDNYTKKEVMIEMRDGIKLHTTIYSPKDTSKTYPMLMMRTPYSCRPYGENEFKSKIGPNKYLMEEGNIMIYQDVRGRWNS